MAVKLPTILEKFCIPLGFSSESQASVASSEISSGLSRLELPQSPDTKGNLSAVPSTPRRNPRKKKRNWAREAREFRPQRAVRVELQSREEVEFYQEICVGPSSAASYRIAARLLGQGLSEARVAKRLEIPLHEVREVQKIRERFEKNQAQKESVQFRLERQIEYLAKEIEATVLEFRQVAAEEGSAKEQGRKITYLSPEMSSDLVERTLLVL